MDNSFYSQDELKELGFKEIGENVLISKKASIYGAKNMIIGSNTRIDDFCIFSGRVTIGSYVHISAGCYLFGGSYGITIKDFVALSSRSAVYAVSDDYSGEAMTNPMVPDKYRKIDGGPVVIGRHCIIGSGSTILPGVVIGDGVSAGSMSLISKSLDPWGVYVGIPCKKLKDRLKNPLELEKKFMEELKQAE